MVILPYDTESKSRNVLASPLGEEGHEVAKGWTVVRMIMIFLFYVLLPPKGETTHYILSVAPLLQPLLSLTHWIFRSLMLPYKSSSHSAKCVRCASLRSGGRRLAVRTEMECHFDALPCTPFCLFEAFPLKGKREVWRGKTASHILQLPFRRFPPLVAGATTFPPQAVAL